MLGIHPEYGRDFSSLNEHSGTDRVAMPSHRLWQERFASNPGVVGQSVQINGKALTIAGVINQRAQFPKDADHSIRNAPTEAQSTRPNETEPNSSPTDLTASTPAVHPSAFIE